MSEFDTEEARRSCGQTPSTWEGSKAAPTHIHNPTGNCAKRRQIEQNSKEKIERNSYM